MDEFSLSAEQEGELLRLHRSYEREVKRCDAGKAYLAGCTIAGAALECALILMVNAYSDEVLATNGWPKKKKKAKPLLEWKFSELLRVAYAAGWLPCGLDHENDDWDYKRAKAGDYAELARQIRNLVHPAVYLDQQFGRRITAKHLRVAMRSVSEAGDALFAKVIASLREARSGEKT